MVEPHDKASEFADGVAVDFPFDVFRVVFWGAYEIMVGEKSEEREGEGVAVVLEGIEGF